MYLYVFVISVPLQGVPENMTRTEFLAFIYDVLINRLGLYFLFKKCFIRSKTSVISLPVVFQISCFLGIPLSQGGSENGPKKNIFQNMGGMRECPFYFYFYLLFLFLFLFLFIISISIFISMSISISIFISIYISISISISFSISISTSTSISISISISICTSISISIYYLSFNGSRSNPSFKLKVNLKKLREF